MADKMVYDKSNLPSGNGAPAPEPEPHEDPTRGPVTGADTNSTTYPSLDSQGMTMIQLPLRNCATTTQKIETLQLRELPRLIGERVSAKLGTLDAVLEFSHLCGALQGAGALGADTQKRMNALSFEFSKVPTGEHQEAFFENKIRPWLETLQVGAK